MEGFRTEEPRSQTTGQQTWNRGGRKDSLLDQILSEELQLCSCLPGSNVFVLGNTGVGKTTFLQWLLGCEFVFVLDELGVPLLQPKDARQLNPNYRIGSTTVSCTTDITPVKLEYDQREFHLIDTPGFIDTEGKTTDLLNFLKTRHAFSVSEETRFILVTDARTLNSSTNRGAGIAAMVKQAAEILGVSVNETNSATIFGSCLFLFSHADSRKKPEMNLKWVRTHLERKFRDSAAGSLQYLVLNGIIEGTIQSAVFDPEKSLKSSILGPVFRSRPVPRHHQYAMPQELNDFVQRRIANQRRDILEIAKRGLFKDAAKRLRTIQRLANLLRSPTISQDVDTVEEDLARKEAEECEKVKASLEAAVAEPGFLELRNVLLEFGRFTKVSCITFGSVLEIGLERLLQLMNPEGCEILLHEVGYLARLAVDDALESTVKTLLNDCVKKVFSKFEKFSEKTRIEGLRALKMIATACSATISIVDQCEGSTTLQFQASHLLSNEDEVEGKRRPGGFVELWEDAYALFFFHKVANKNLIVKQHVVAEYEEWNVLDEELGKRREELAAGMKLLLSDNCTLSLAADIILDSKKALEQNAFKEVAFQVFDPIAQERQLVAKLFTWLGSLTTLDEDKRSSLESEIRDIEAVATKLDATNLLEACAYKTDFEEKLEDLLNRNNSLASNNQPKTREIERITEQRNLYREKLDEIYAVARPYRPVGPKRAEDSYGDWRKVFELSDVAGGFTGKDWRLIGELFGLPIFVPNFFA